MRMRISLCAASGIITMLVVAATSFGATSRIDLKQLEGRIAFVSDRNGHSEVYVMNADGSGQSALTRDDWEQSLSPAWSRDGSKIVFCSYRDGNGEIYLMNADGSGKKRLTQNSVPDVSPAFSPDGRQIVYCSTVSDQNGDGNQHLQLFLMNADGKASTRLTHNSAFDTQPVFSTDGRKIVFVSNRDSSDQAENLEIYSINADGSALTRLTHNAAEDAAPVFSPDGKEIAFVSRREGASAIYLMRNDGTQVRRLSAKGVIGRHPSWSPDGNTIVFESENAKREVGLYAMDAKGEHLTPLPLSPNHNFRPVWGRGPRITDPLSVVFAPLILTPSLTLEPASAAVAKTARALLQIPKPLSPPFYGHLLYAFMDAGAPTSYAMTLREIGAKEPTQRAGNSPDSTYFIKGLPGEVEQTPKFSPDGQYALIGSFSYTSSLQKRYWNYIWDTRLTQLKPVMPASFNGEFLGWSPDGNWMLFMTADSATSIPHLEVVDWRKQKRVSLPSAATQLNWMAPHSILYSALPAQLPQEEKEGVAAGRPNIYSFSPETGQSTRLVQDGQLPTASNDGQWIAFFGSANPKKPSPLNDEWQYRATGVSLSVARKDGTERKDLRSIEGDYPTVIWEADNRRLLVLQMGQVNEKTIVQLQEYDTNTNTWRQITKLQSEEVTSLGLSLNGKFLFLRLKTTDNTALGQNEAEVHLLQAVEIRTGRIYTLARLNGVMNFDWKETAEVRH